MVDFFAIGMGTAWLLLGVNTFMGLKQKDYVESTYGRRYYSKYRKLAAEQKHAADAGHH